MIGKAFASEVGDLIRYDAKVTRIQQNDRGVTVSYVDTPRLRRHAATGESRLVRLHHSALDPEPDPDRRRRPHEGGDRRGALCVGSVKIGLQFKRRFWEEDEAIYGGISYTDLPIRQIAYPEHRLQSQRPRRAARAPICSRAPMPTNSPRWRRRNGSRARSNSARSIHPQYSAEFENGIAVAWHRVPFTLGCAGRLERRRRGQSITTICARSTAGSCWRASMPPTFRPGRRARSFPRSTPSRGCTTAW